jgi:chromosome segregation ATPase
LADQTVIQDLIVRVIGDPTNFQQTMTWAAKVTGDVGDAAKQTSVHTKAAAEATSRHGHDALITHASLHRSLNLVTRDMGELGHIVSAATMAGLGFTAAIVVFGAATAKAMYDSATGADTLKRRLEELQYSLDRTALANRRLRDIRVEDATSSTHSLSGFRRQVDMLKELTQQTTEASQEFEKLRKVREILNERTTQGIPRTREDIRYLRERGFTDQSGYVSRETRETIDARTEAAKKRFEELDEARAKLDPTGDAVSKYSARLHQATVEATAFVREQEFMAATIGKTAEETQIYLMELYGLDPQLIATARGLVEMNKAAKETEERQKTIKGEIHSAQEALVSYGMSTEDARLVVLRFNNATESELANLAGTLDMHKQLDAMTAANRRAAEAMMADLDELFSMGDAATQAMQTPLEAYRQTMFNLQEMLRVGAVDQTTYGRAVEDAAKKLDEAEQAARGLRSELQKLNTLRFGGQEFAGEVYRQQFGALAGPTLGASAAREQARQYQSGVSGKAERLLEEIARNTADTIGLVEANF